MLFLVIETWRDHNTFAVYRRFQENGPMLPDGLKYRGSWTEANLRRCFQLMDCEDGRLLQQRVARWGDLVDFEIVAVCSSKDTSEVLSPLL